MDPFHAIEGYVHYEQVNAILIKSGHYRLYMKDIIEINREGYSCFKDKSNASMYQQVRRVPDTSQENASV
jgi:hypothetical protein